jgi:hypothetical protein
LVPQRITRSLKLTHVKLKLPTEAEASINFMPNNLAFQQLPFIINIKDLGDRAKPEMCVDHYIFSCWFAESSVKWAVSEKDDCRLVESVNVKVGRMLTIDNTNGGNPVVQAVSNLFSGVSVLVQDQDLISGLRL